MTTAGPNSPSSAEHIVDTAPDWVDPTNVLSSNDTYATTVADFQGVSDYLAAYGFAMAIPAGATINGVLVEVECKAGSGTFTISASLYADASAGTGYKGAKSSSQGTTESYAQLGGLADTWNGGLDADYCNGSNFGVRVFADAITNGVTYYIDHIRISVAYTPAGHPAHARWGGVPHVGSMLARVDSVMRWMRPLLRGATRAPVGV